ncbi:hypothetical protein [Mesorhizobium sp.]|uniref:hypothetical protein n=1 Tax=Mesorhizobium sp. TaxID=1871066 RepID=UPI00257FE09F|nr:hypothetical protein [Mesorhizobium sp.]
MEIAAASAVAAAMTVERRTVLLIVMLMHVPPFVPSQAEGSSTNASASRRNASLAGSLFDACRYRKTAAHPWVRPEGMLLRDMH